ncbi:epimerase [Candidatus Roizmanbacteria bacterium RIFCSPHIGHO2_12_FULL_38_13]|nr:MAG: epimerase [Candidatus Roizmanbacteria bacterium RIFCSPHIGHO2_12_FULL_38_13]
MTILITGGAGFLGLHLAHFFIKKGWHVKLFDVAPYPKAEYPSSVECLTGNVRNKKSLAKAMKGVEVVIHAAAALPLQSSQEIMRTNVQGTKNVLETCLNFHIKNVVYISSTAVYGVPEKHPVYEDDPLVGVGPYGQSKIDAEELCRMYQNKGLIVTIIRPKTFVGTHRLGVFEILFDWIKDNKKIPLIGSGKNRYQLLEVSDLVYAIYSCISHQNKKAINTVFNVGASKFKTVREDLQAMFKNVESKSKILPTPAFPIKTALMIFEYLKLSPLYKWVYATADKDSFVSIDKIMKVTGWRPRYSNTESLVKAYRWYEEHYDEIKSRGSGTTHTVGWKQGVLGLFKKFL